MIRRLSFQVIFGLLFLGINAYAQQAQNWYFPENVGVRFDNQEVFSLPWGKVCTSVPSNVQIRPTEGGACISDSKGNLLFYTDGVTIWNRNHAPMKEGQNLKGGPSATQPASIVPDPGNPSRYYVFTLDDFQHTLKNGLCYTVVDMCLDNGLGDVTAEKNIPLLSLAGEKQAITKHKNDTDYWLVVHKHFSNAFYAYKISAKGIDDPVISYIGSNHEGGLYAGTATAIGQMKISPDGSKIGLVNANLDVGNDRALLEAFNFNNETGKVSNYVNLTDLIYSVFHGFYGGYGFAFSPNSKNAYVYTTLGILQFHFNNSWWTYINVLAPSSILLNRMGGMQLAPNGKIYIAKGESFLSSISDPDNLVPSAGFVLNDVFLDDGIATWSLPGFYDGFRYLHPDPPCSPGGNGGGGDRDCISSFYPNPFSDYLNIRLNAAAVKDIRFYNTVGQLVLTYQPSNHSAISIDTRNLKDNVYVVVVTKLDGTVCINKLFKK